MATLTRDYHETVVERLKREPSFAQSMLDEARDLTFNGEPEIARLHLRDLVNATIGFEQLAIQISIPSKSLHRMLSSRGNPGMNTLSRIFAAIREKVSSAERLAVG